MRNIRSQLHAAKTLVLLSKVQPPSLLHTNHGGASHRDVHKYVPAKLDVEYHRLMRMVVGPPAGTNWASPWHYILHGWNNKIRVLSDHAGVKPWSATCIKAVKKFASYVATVPTERWNRRILERNSRGATETRTTCLHLGNRAGKILHLGLVQ